jgi:hypothetical protein
MEMDSINGSDFDVMIVRERSSSAAAMASMAIRAMGAFIVFTP